MLEKQIEKKFREKVESIGGKALKFISPGCRGVPDRLVFLPGGRVILVELKAPGKKLRPLQLKMKREFERMGFQYYVIDSFEAVGDFFKGVKT